MISFGFTPGGEDYRKSFQTYYRENWIPSILFPVYILLVGIFLFIAGSYGTSGLGNTLYFGLFFAFVAVFYVLFVFVINPRIIAARAAKDERMSSPVQYEVTDEQMVVRTTFSEIKTDWGQFQKVIDGKEVILLLHHGNVRLFQFIPKRAFASPDDERAFVELARRKVVPAQSRFDWSNPAFRMAVIGGLIFLALICLITSWSFLSF